MNFKLLRQVSQFALWLCGSLVAAIVHADNAAPLPTANQSFTTPEDTVRPGVVTATDTDGDTLSFTLHTPPVAGKLTLESSGTFSYQPAKDYNGSDSFSFTVSDGNATSNGDASITITPVNDLPYGVRSKIRAKSDVTYSGYLSGYDADDDAVTFHRLPGTGATHGLLSINPDGYFEYMSDSDYFGPDTFSYIVKDAEGSSDPIVVDIDVVPGSLQDDVGIVADTLIGALTIHNLETGGVYQFNLPGDDKAVDIAIDHARSRVYALTSAGSLEVYDFIWTSASPRLDHLETIAIQGKFIQLTPDSRTAYIAGDREVTSINLFEEGLSSSSGYVDAFSNRITYPVYGRTAEKIRAMAMHPDGERLFVVTQEDTPTGNFLDLEGKYPISLSELPTHSYLNHGGTSKYRQFSDASTIVTGYVGVSDMAITPDGNCALVTVEGAQKQRATPFGIRPIADEASGGVIVVDLNNHNLLGVLSSVLKGEDPGGFLKEVSRVGRTIEHPTVTYYRSRSLTAETSGDALSLMVGNNAAGVVASAAYADHQVSLYALGLYLDAYQNYGFMLSYANAYPTDMVAPSGVGILGSGDRALVAMQDTNNLGILRLSESIDPGGYKWSDAFSRPDSLDFNEGFGDKPFYFEGASQKTINGLGFDNGRYGTRTEWLYLGELRSTPGADHALMGMRGGVPNFSEASNLFGSAPVPELLLELENVKQASENALLAEGDSFTGIAISGAFKLIESGAHVSPQQVATFSEQDSDGDGVSNHIEAFNRWNSYRDLEIAANKQVVSVNFGSEVSSPTKFQSVDCSELYFLPHSGVGYRFNIYDNEEFSMSLGTWSTVSSIEAMGAEWHQKYLWGQVNRPYFQVAFLANPAGDFLLNTNEEKLMEKPRTGREACFPYSKINSDEAHDFVLSNGPGSPNDNTTQVTSGFDVEATESLLRIILADPTVVAVSIDPLALAEMSDPALNSHPKVLVRGILDENVASRRDLDSFMLVEFSCAYPIDLDVDSDNNGGYAIVDGSSDEEALENPRELGESFASRHFGKITTVNDGDVDRDGIPDYADGTTDTRGVGNVSSTETEWGNLVPVVLKFPAANNLPPDVNEADLRVRFIYDASDPSHPSAANDYELPADGSMRLWLGEDVQPPQPYQIRDVRAVESGGHWIRSSEWYSKADLAITGSEITLFMEAVAGMSLYGDSTIRVEVSYLESGTHNALGDDEIAFTLIDAEIVPDYNRDGFIDDDDRGWVSKDNPYRFWVNDDQDVVNEEAADESDDTPHDFALPVENQIVDGVRDLVDFFPLHLDLAGVLQTFPKSEFDYYLKHEDAAVKFLEKPDVEPTATPENNGPAAYLRDVTEARSLNGATLSTLGANGFRLSDTLLNASVAGRGILLCEVVATTEKPIQLEVRNKKNGASVSVSLFPVKTTGVEQMYRHLNLREVAGGSGGRDTEMDVPLNYPDDIPGLTSDKWFVLAHGYNVNGEQARAWHAEFFKRMWWSGSKAKFVGVSWRGDQSQNAIVPDLTANYHINVLHAINSAGDLTLGLSGLQGQVTISAHSLGNMLVSAAIQDHDLSVANYFPFNAAVASEAYHSGIPFEDDMTNRNWEDYPERVWASEWYTLPWGANGWQKELTWRGRFGDVASRTNVVNFFSSGEEVLQNADDSLNHGSVLGAIANNLFFDWLILNANVKGEYTWALQELHKGRGLTGEIIGSTYGGWKFHYEAPTITGNPGAGYWKQEFVLGLPINDFRMYEPSEASGITDQELMELPFFTLIPENYDQSDVTKLLAEAFPARSFAAGRNPVATFGDNKNMMELTNSWWYQGQIDDPENRWLHGDLKDVAYIHTHQIYTEFVTIGVLNE